MLKIRMVGGLGNQLFQIATALKCVDLDFSKIELEVSSLKKNGHGGYRLDHLCFPEIKKKDAYVIHVLLCRVVDKFPLLCKFLPNIFHEKYYKSINICNGVMIGYWQNAENFHDIREVLKRYIVPKKLEPLAIDLSSIMQSVNSVSVHVRRGDYENKETLENHGVCSVRYYIDSINFIESNVNNPVYYIFSNDQQWVRDNLGSVLKGKNINYVDGLSQENDLWLMTKCKYSIIANSSFSWWGAYLKDYFHEYVVSPSPWYEREQRSSKDPSLKSWVRFDK